jgi:hypothetical protein
MSSYEYNQLLKFLYFEGYADSYEEAEYILEDMSDDEFEELIEIRSQKPWSAPKTERFKREIERQKKQREKTPNSSLRPGDQAALKRMIARGKSPTRSASKPDPTPTEKPKGTRTIKKTELASIVKEDFDIIAEYLFVEGYADTIESAELIAESISEQWVNEILDEKEVGGFSEAMSNRPEEPSHGRYPDSNKIDLAQQNAKKRFNKQKEIEAKWAKNDTEENRKK